MTASAEKAHSFNEHLSREPSLTQPPEPVSNSPSYPSPRSHSQRNYRLALMGLGVVVLILGGVVAYSQLSINQLQQRNAQLQSDLSMLQSIGNFTWLSGAVSLPAGNTGGDTILFDTQTLETLSATIFDDNTYQLFLPSERTYSVEIFYWDSTEVLTACPNAQPTTITPTDALSQVDFTC